MIIHRPRVGLGNLTAPGTTTGLARVTSMVILGVTISDDLRFNNHVQRLCCQARQSFYALRTLVAYGLRGLHLYDVVRATTLARMLYASPAWWGFVGQRDKDRFEVLMRRLIRYHYLPGDSLSFEQLCIKADCRLFSSILVDNGHVLHELLPPIKTSKYSLRPRAHDRIIPPADNLMRKGRYMYIRSDQDWLTFLYTCGTIMICTKVRLAVGLLRILSLTYLMRE